MNLDKKLRAHSSRLDEIAGVKFRDADIKELIFHLEAYLTAPEHDPLIIPDWMLTDAIQSAQPRQAVRDRRRLFVEGVEGVWRGCGGRKKGSYYHVEDGVHGGPLVKLIQALLQIADIANPPSAASVHHDLDALYRNKERPR